MNDTSEGMTELINSALGAVFMVVELTDGTIPPCFSRRMNEKSRIEQNCFDFWGIAAIGEIFSSAGGLSLMEPTTQG